MIAPLAGARPAPAAAGTPRRLRRLVALALATAGALATLTAVTAPPAAAACQHPNATLEQQTLRADAVFTGTVGARAAEGRRVTYEVEVDLVHKGDVGEQATVVTPSGPRACGVPDLQNGQEYVWFVAAGQGAQDTWIATRDGGTTRATAAHVRQVEGLLGPGASPTPVEPVEATFTRVAGEPTALSRIAAPGAALVLVGLLGLLLVGALGRRRG